MNFLPNALTISRIVLAGFFVVFITQRSLLGFVMAAIVFVLASLTDYYDGYFAKKYNINSDFGKIMDPIADKFLILMAFFIFVQMNIIAGWMFFLIFWREIIVTGSRLVAVRKGKVLGAETAGKCKTVSQMAVILVILTFLILRESHFASQWNQNILGGWQWTITVLMFITVALTLYSGITYLWNNRKFIYA